MKFRVEKRVSWGCGILGGRGVGSGDEGVDVGWLAWSGFGVWGDACDKVLRVLFTHADMRFVAICQRRRVLTSACYLCLCRKRAVLT